MKASALSLLALVLTPFLALAQGPADLNTITRVEVRGNSVVITGTKKPNFTTFTMTDPARLVIDISEAVFSGVPEELPVTNGTVTGIRTASYGSEATAIARVLIGFSREVETDFQADGTTLVVKVLGEPAAVAQAAPQAPAQQPAAQQPAPAQQPAAAKPAGPAPVAAAPAAPADAGTTGDATAAARADRDAQEKAAAQAAAAAKADRDAQEKAAAQAAAAAKADQEALQKAAAEATARNDQQRREQAQAKADAEKQAKADAAKQAQAEKQAQADAAAAAKAEKQRLAEEARKAEAEKKAQAQAEKQRAAEEARAAADAKKAEAQKEAQARAAEAADKKQADAEARRQAAAEAQEKKRADAEAKKQALADARAERAEAARAKREAQASQGAEGSGDGQLAVRGGRSTMTFVGFKQEASSSRVFVRTSAPVRYTVSEGEGGTLILELENTRIGLTNNTRALDTSFFDTAVAAVDPSAGPSRTVRIAIRLKSQVPYQARQEGNEVSLEFPRPSRR
ncbi:AMIN domain-containing protein [Aggregicoccus sp. 17bor-14]|uniref:AMIN domain-containing protein n=1 Tax=Myxococcaceae TaxID=31 RepID=UPI00129C68CE|nr:MULTISPECIES: AMIN domain-containing protein [Myxococcaceae]MBF5041384.1 AMIN domain-containing protein [Simulacricoccus sp. 17bor-14]MRI87168.1 AMIN domain-containing protein [Aggregicoccus sp. 17bor-14]